MGEAEGGSMGKMCFIVVAVWFTLGIILSAGLFIVYIPDVLFVSNCASNTLLFRFRAGSLAADTNGGGCILGAVSDELLRDLLLAFI